ncbi:MAG: AMP-binding protein, partial [Hyphomonas sp.]
MLETSRVPDSDLYPVPADFAAHAHMDRQAYEAARIAARETPDAFWSEQAKRLDWIKAPTRIKDVSFKKEDFRIRWFEDGVLNVSANCIDRHLPHRKDETAIIWEGDDPADSRHITFGELHAEVCRMANVLRAHGAKKGDRITLYLPMIPEAAYAMLACARIGAVHSVVFG